MKSITAYTAYTEPEDKGVINVTDDVAWIPMATSDLPISTTAASGTDDYDWN